MTAVTADIVIPTTRPALLARLLRALDEHAGRTIVVDGRGRSPAEARNIGWRRSRAEWVVFLDDDVVPSPQWREDLDRDLEAAPPEVAGTQGVVRVPLPVGRRATDWERHVSGLESAAWITADMAYRRSVLAELGGFDERFGRAYREDSDLAVRVLRAGYGLRRGSRRVSHPVGRGRWWESVARQRGNADDALMLAKHGPAWRELAGATRGRLRRHVLAAGLAGLTTALAATRHRRLAAFAALAWLLETAALARHRISPGPRTASEVGSMVATSAVLPLAAVGAAVGGRLAHTRLRAARRSVDAVLFDRDGTLVVDVPYNGDPTRVVAAVGARAAVARCRAAGLRVGVVTNQSGIGRGLLRLDQVAAVNDVVDRLLGPFDAWVVCPHAPNEGCGCRKPAPGGVLAAAEQLGVRPERCVVVGDIGSDVQAARAAGARAVLVPTPATRAAEIASAPAVASSLCAAVELVLGGAP